QRAFRRRVKAVKSGLRVLPSKLGVCRRRDLRDPALAGLFPLKADARGSEAESLLRLFEEAHACSNPEGLRRCRRPDRRSAAARRAHDSADNLLQPYQVELQASRAKQRWEVPSLHVAFTVTLAGGSRTDCESWYILLEPLEKTSD